MIKRLTKIFCVVLFLFSCFTYAEEWEYIGPDGGPIHHLVQDFRNNGLWFTVAGRENRLYRSTDRANRSSSLDDFQAELAGDEWSIVGIFK